MAQRERKNFMTAIWHQRELIWRLTVREVLSRYRGSVAGWAWTFLNPLAMLTVYTFVFSQVFKAKWGGSGSGLGSLDYAVSLFAGLIVFNQISECVVKAPSLILANPSYVKKIVFPLEILSAVSVSSAFIHTFTSLSILAIFEVVAKRFIPVTFLWIPLVWIPLVLGCLAASWLLFISPVFFPLSALPSRWQPLLGLNPAAIIIEQTRQVAVLGNQPSFNYIIIGTILGAIAAECSYRFFLRVKPGFADVV
jgi:lipopolysaccharide transport system permease protein